MNEQLGFWQEPEHGLARRTDPVTSHMAAREVNVRSRQAQVLSALRQVPKRGLINSEICKVTGLEWNTASPRLRELVNKGLVYDSQEKRLGPKNKWQIVWKAY